MKSQQVMAFGVIVVCFIAMVIAVKMIVFPSSPEPRYVYLGPPSTYTVRTSCYTFGSTLSCNSNTTPY